MNLRLLAARLVADWLHTQRFPERDFEQVDAGRPFVMEVVYGVVRQRRALEWIRIQLAPRQPAPKVEALLFTGLYQLLFMDTVEDYAAVHETVEAAKKMTGTRQAAFLNATLRRASRERVRLCEQLGRQTLGVRTSHPEILLDRWCRHLPAADIEKLCAWNNTPPPVMITRLQQDGDVETFCTPFAGAGIELTPHPFAPDRSFVLPRGLALRELPGYEAGGWLVQDPSTLMATDLMGAQPGQTLLDACAAPGGKTMVLASAVGPSGHIVAMDRQASRLQRVTDNAARQGFKQVAAIAADATDSAAWRRNGLPDRFDGVLLDAPCTNTGVLRRRPDARWRFSEKHLANALRAQRKLLTALAERVAPGGALVYSTCSLEPEENHDQVAAWLAKNPGFQLEAERSCSPWRDGVDGAYAVRLRKKAPSKAGGESG